MKYRLDTVQFSGRKSCFIKLSRKLFVFEKLAFFQNLKIVWNILKKSSPNSYISLTIINYSNPGTWIWTSLWKSYLILLLIVLFHSRAASQRCTINMFGLYAKPCKSTRYTMKSMLMVVRWGKEKEPEFKTSMNKLQAAKFQRNFYVNLNISNGWLLTLKVTLAIFLVPNTLNQEFKSSKHEKVKNFSMKLIKSKTKGTASPLKPPRLGTPV